MGRLIPHFTPRELAHFRSELLLGGCGLIWGGRVNNMGYGRFEMWRDGNRIRLLAHRAVYKLSTGEDPGQLKVRHRCDTPICCTPDCLELGTQADNMHDAVVRGRFNKTGLAIPHRKHEVAAAQRIDAQLKRCKHCGEVKSFVEFSRHSGTLDGRQYYCKSCMVGYQRQRREMKRERRAAA